VKNKEQEGRKEGRKGTGTEPEKKSVTTALILLQFHQWDYMTMQGYYLCTSTGKTFRSREPGQPFFNIPLFTINKGTGARLKPPLTVPEHTAVMLHFFRAILAPHLSTNPFNYSTKSFPQKPTLIIHKSQTPTHSTSPIITQNPTIRPIKSTSKSLKNHRNLSDFT
jgi:hypothetical protein